MAVAGALARFGEVRLDRPPRMADFATWVTAAEPALLDALEKLLGDGPRPRGWPENGQALSTVLQRLAPNLREAGWLVERIQTSGKGSRKV